MRSLLIGALLLVGCPHPQGTQAVVATVANGIMVELEGAYQNDGDRCVAQAVQDMHEDKCAPEMCKRQAETCIAKVEERWAPIWFAYDQLRAANDTAVAWCEFVKRLDDAGVVVPAIAGVACK